MRRAERLRQESQVHRRRYGVKHAHAKMLARRRADIKWTECPPE